MKIKQQAQVRAFLIQSFGSARGRALFAQQEKTLRALMECGQNKSIAQRLTLARMILPSIALYKVLLKNNIPQADAYEHLRRYLMDTVAAGMHASITKVEVVPGFFWLYRAGFLAVVRISGLWESTQHCGRGCFDVTIQKCLWHTACAEHSCPELCRLFCDADTITYGGLNKIGFTRTKTLGTSGNCCDFHFFKK